MVELVAIEPLSNVEIMEVIDSPKATMCSKGSNAELAVQKRYKNEAGSPDVSHGSRMPMTKNMFLELSTLDEIVVYKRRSPGAYYLGTTLWESRAARK